MLPFQSLNPGQFIITNNPLSLLGQFLGLMIETIDVLV